MACTLWTMTYSKGTPTPPPPLLKMVHVFYPVRPSFILHTLHRVLFSVTSTHTDEPFFVSYDFTSAYGHLSVLSFAVAFLLNLH